MKHINFIGPFNRTGYGIASCGYAYGLIKAAKANGVTVSFLPIGQIDQNDPELKRPEYQSIVNSMATPIVWEEPTVCFWHLSHLSHYLGNSKGLKVGITTFETDVLLEPEVSGARATHKMIVACEFNKNVLNKYNIPTEVIPHGFGLEGVPQRVPYEDATSKWESDLGFSLTDHKIISTVGKFESRKGFKELLEALFISKRKYLLVAFWFNPFMEHGYPVKYLIENNWEPVLTKSGVKAYRKNNVTVCMMPNMPMREQVYNIVRHSHAYVCTSKAEGWNLPLFDVMSLGMPCITTTNTAMKDYTEGCVVNISSGLEEVAHDGQFFHGNRGNWEKLDINLISAKIEDALWNMNLSKLSDNSYSAVSKLNNTWSRLGKLLFDTIANEQRALG